MLFLRALLIRFSVQDCNLSSPNSFKILTPARKYDTVQKQSTPVCRNLFPNSPSLSITPTTKSWGNDIHTLLQHSVKEILNIGLLPTALICDQGSQNRKLFSLLGGNETNPTTEIHVSEKCNCETDSDNYLTVDILSDVEINNTIKDPIPNNCCFKTSDVDSTDFNLSFTSESDVTDMTDTETV
ncbi:hypothetical protein QTP88_001363 [Uroleucon formosanum]